ncbi:MAG: amidohydrolase family protein, partial [Pseudolysinimonas sp.]
MLLPVFTDSHVHLGLVDPADLIGGGVGRVLDLGWDPAVDWHAPPLIIDRAGPLLAAPGGYPLNAGWGPVAGTREIPDAAAAASAIARLADLGAAVAKITLNAEAGPVWNDSLLTTVVALAHEAHLPVVAHTQGAGQAKRALAADVDALAHTPRTETLSDAVIAQMAQRVAWISTLDIHGWGAYGDDFARALGNLERFAAAGGTVHYGTDLGNGPLPAGLNRRELEALDGAGVDLVAALRGMLPVDDRLVQDVPADTLADITLDTLLAST